MRQTLAESWLRLRLWWRVTRRNRYREAREEQTRSVVLARPFSQPAAKGFRAHHVEDRRAHLAQMQSRREQP